MKRHDLIINETKFDQPWSHSTELSTEALGAQSATYS